jgi:single stranded DNA-binding protein
MRSVNRLTIVGNVGKVTTVGKVVKVNIATNRQWARDGEIKKATDWLTVTVLDETQADWIAENVEKGDAVYVEARVCNNSYEKDGERIYTVDVIVTLFNKLSRQAESE